MKNKVRFYTILVVASVFMTIPAFSITKAESEKLLQLAQDNSGFYETDFSGNYTVVQEKPGEGKKHLQKRLCQNVLAITPEIEPGKPLSEP